MTQSLNGSFETISHRVDRLTIQIDDSFDGFRDRYERAVPEYQTDRFDTLIEKGVAWHTILDATAENAPHDFILYWSREFTSLMGLARTPRHRSGVTPEGHSWPERLSQRLQAPSSCPAGRVPQVWDWPPARRRPLPRVRRRRRLLHRARRPKVLRRAMPPANAARFGAPRRG
jgi:hypothetical protein